MVVSLTLTPMLCARHLSAHQDARRPDAFGWHPTFELDRQIAHLGLTEPEYKL